MKIKVQETAPPKTAWSGWINLGGGDFDSIAATNNADGRIVLVGAHTNGKPLVSQQISDQPFDAKTWTKWDVPGGITNDGFGGMTANLDANGAVVLSANTAGGMMYLSRQDPPGSNTWSAWSQPGFIQDNVLKHDVTIDGNGHLYIGVLNVGTKGTKNIIYGIQQTSVEYAQWTGWDRVAMIDSANQIDLAYNADGSIVMFAYDANLKELFYLNQVAVNSTEWFVEWTSIADGFERIAIGRDLTPGPNLKVKSKRRRRVLKK